MSVVTLSEILKDAHEKKYAVAMLDVFNLEMIYAVIEAAETEKSPVILALAEAHANLPRKIAEMTGVINCMAQKSSVPVCTHFDHGMHVECCISVMHHGFSSVMFDGSALPYEENIGKTKEVVKYASICGASVEAELGHVGNAEGGGDDGVSAVLTDPEQTVDFVSRTKVDALAVSIGTTHGLYKSKTALDIERLTAIRAKCPVPLVLHGGSGLSNDDYNKCIKAGISKINIYSEFVQAGIEYINDVNRSKKLNYWEISQQSIDTMKDFVRQKMQIFGSSGRAVAL